MSSYYVDPSLNSDTGTGTIGDPFGDLQYCLNTITRDATNGDQINIKSGTAESITTGLSLTTYGTPTLNSSLIIRGYTSTENDGGKGEIDCNALTSLFAATTNSYIILADLKIGNCGSRNLVYLNAYCVAINCHFHSVVNGHMLRTSTNCKVINCRFDNHVPISGTYYTVYCQGQALVANNFIDTEAAIANYITSASSVIIGNLVKVKKATALAGISTTSLDLKIINNSVYSSVACTGTGINFNSSSYHSAYIANNYVEGFTGAGGTGFKGNSSLRQAYLFNNKAFNNTTDFDIFTIYLDKNNTSLSGSGFVDASSDDFSPSAELKAGAFPNPIGYDFINSYNDIGAIQHQDAGGGGGGSVNTYVHSIFGL